MVAGCSPKVAVGTQCVATATQVNRTKPKDSTKRHWSTELALWAHDQDTVCWVPGLAPLGLEVLHRFLGHEVLSHNNELLVSWIHTGLSKHTLQASDRLIKLTVLHHRTTKGDEQPQRKQYERKFVWYRPTLFQRPRFRPQLALLVCFLSCTSWGHVVQSDVHTT